MADWVDVCALDDIDPEDAIRCDHAGSTFAIYRAPDGAALRAPVCVNLATYPARIAGDRIEIQI